MYSVYDNDHTWKPNQTNNNKIKVYETVASKSDATLFTFLKSTEIENSWNFLYLPHQFSHYHPVKMLVTDLMCPIVRKKLKQQYYVACLTILIENKGVTIRRH